MARTSHLPSAGWKQRTVRGIPRTSQLLFIPLDFIVPETLSRDKKHSKIISGTYPLRSRIQTIVSLRSIVAEWAAVIPRRAPKSYRSTLQQLDCSPAMKGSPYDRDQIKYRGPSSIARFFTSHESWSFSILSNVTTYAYEDRALVLHIGTVLLQLMILGANVGLLDRVRD
ncbi:hypothetical protein P691DRAFT_788491 [Macrolepiota fuliginosa MF-IS2]|uniref:Uncharacterized protein n=1 Tax=Macrolepiota fuliginosa MF-IS2 TaxID=1400762 RepID=A0A9P5XH18_9AGAR|nr:hypothetical protein P691DRAFT_788491 [Macrolepiota fuliginosa MF-IS2]